MTNLVLIIISVIGVIYNRYYFEAQRSIDLSSKIKTKSE